MIYDLICVVHAQAFSIRNADRLVVSCCGRAKGNCSQNTLHDLKNLKPYWPFAVHT